MDLSTFAPTIISACSGIGGLDLGVQAAIPNARTILYVERELFSVGILAKQMENESLDSAPIWSDLATVPTDLYRGRTDMVIGGIPCQPFSTASSRLPRGTSDARWLWSAFWRVVDETGASWIFIENVPAIRHSGLEAIIRTLAGHGWNAEWDTFSACEVGAPHMRKRLFLLAHTSSQHGKWAGRIRTRSTPERHIQQMWRNAPPEPFRVAYGLADKVDRIAALGNAVVPPTATLAMQTLFARLMS